VSNEETNRVLEALQPIKREQERWTTTSKTTSKGPVATQKTSSTSATTEEPISHLTPHELHKEEGDESQTAPEESPTGQSAPILEQC